VQASTGESWGCDIPEDTSARLAGVLSAQVEKREMITVDVTVSDGCLRINCAGRYGPRSECNLASGRLVQEAIRHHLDTADPPLSEIVINFTRVDCEGMGDGPIWSVLEAWRRGVKVSYLVGEHTREALEVLLSVTNMNQIIGVIVVRDD
jgi:hypothetical protein